MKRALMACVLVAGCEGDGGVVVCGEGTVLNATGDTCLADLTPSLACGAGTVQSGGECVPEGSRHFEIRLLDREISADRLQAIPVRVAGTNADGSPVVGEAIISIDRPGAGSFPNPRFELDGLGG